MRTALGAFQWIVLVYFAGINAAYLGLNLISLASMTRYARERVTDALPRAASGLEPPVTVIVPAHNEELTIEATVLALLQLSYPRYEVVVVNDGSTDATLDVLRRRFRLVPLPEAYRTRLPTRPVRAIYLSTQHPNLRVVDKDNGGKADALNAGINAARYPLFCAVDADSVLQRDSLTRVARPFLEDATTVAAGGTVRIANGCRVSGGFLEQAGVPRNPLALFQVVEYLRAFLFGRFGWSPLNALLIVSGAFGLFHKDVVVEAGGYCTDTVGEDMELIVRLHRRLRLASRPYRITFVPDPICWTEAPEDLRTLGRQRRRWQRGLAESLWAHRRLLFHPRGGAVGWLAFPFALLFECFGPLVEVGGYVVFLAAYAAGLLDLQALAAFGLLAVGVGTLLSASALLLEELSFHVYPRPRQLAALAAGVVGENLGFRQLTSLWRVAGLVSWLARRRPSWGRMRRGARWRAA